jgi:hypothetical protein
VDGDKEIHADDGRDFDADCDGRMKRVAMKSSG